MTRADRAALAAALGPRRSDLRRALEAMIREHRASHDKWGTPRDPRGTLRAARRVHHATVVLRRALAQGEARGAFAGLQDFGGGRTLRAWLADLEGLAAFAARSRRRGRQRDIDRLWFAVKVAGLFAEHHQPLVPTRSGVFVGVLRATLPAAGEYLPVDLHQLATQALASYHRLGE